MNLQDAAQTIRPDATSGRSVRARVASAAPAIGTAVEVVAIATSPVVASWLANDFGLVFVGLYFVLAGMVSFVVSLMR